MLKCPKKNKKYLELGSYLVYYKEDTCTFVPLLNIYASKGPFKKYVTQVSRCIMNIVEDRRHREVTPRHASENL